MKYPVIITTAISVLFLNTLTFSQGKGFDLTTSVIQPYHLVITNNKTTSLIFPYTIRSVDRGSQDVLAQKAEGVENILFIKAGKEAFAQTNLSVITADGKFYSFLLDYVVNPPTLSLTFNKEGVETDTALSQLTGINEATMQTLSEKIVRDKRRIRHFRTGKYKMQFRLSGIYIENDVLYFKLEIENHSNIGYNIEMLRFFIKDEMKSKRTASQEIEIQPIFISGDASLVKEQSKTILVYALPKFTIPDRKFLSVQLTEKNGGRHLHLNMLNSTIVKARFISK